MPTHTKLFIEGLDPTGLAAFGASEALQMIQQAIPSLKHGLVYVDDTMPDLVNNPEYARFIWVAPTTGAFKYWNGATWVQFQLAIGSIDGTKITPGTLPTTAINLIGSTAHYLLRVNITNNGLEFVAPINIFSAGSLTIDKLVPATVSGQFLRTVGGTVNWYTLTSSEILSLINNGSIGLSKLYTTGSLDKQIPVYDAAAGYPKWKDIADIITIPSASPTIPHIKVFKIPNTTPIPPGTTHIDYTWTVPTGVTRARFKMWGAGGGGEYGSTTIGGGGGSGAYVEFVSDTTPGDIYTLAIGVYGLGGIFGTLVHATAGGDTTVTLGVLIATAKGGSPGFNTVPGAGGTIIGTLTDAIEIIGMNGQIGTLNADSGQGGSAPMGGGGGQYIGPGVSGVGNEPGGGGGGGDASFDGGSGGKGMVSIEY